jgi:hypothetical protein
MMGHTSSPEMLVPDQKTLGKNPETLIQCVNRGESVQSHNPYFAFLLIFKWQLIK